MDEEFVDDELYEWLGKMIFQWLINYFEILLSFKILEIYKMMIFFVQYFFIKSNFVKLQIDFL